MQPLTYPPSEQRSYDLQPLQAILLFAATNLIHLASNPILFAATNLIHALSDYAVCSHYSKRSAA